MSKIKTVLKSLYYFWNESGIFVYSTFPEQKFENDYLFYKLPIWMPLLKYSLRHILTSERFKPLFKKFSYFSFKKTLIWMTNIEKFSAFANICS